MRVASRKKMAVIRRFFIGLGAAFGIITLGLLIATLALQNRGTQERLRVFLESVASDALDAHVTIAELTLILLPPASLTLRGVVIKHPDPTVYAFAVDHASITLRPFPSTTGHWVRTDVALTGVRASGDTLQIAHHVQRAQGTPSPVTPKPFAVPTDLPFYLNSAAIQDLNIILGLDNGDVLNLSHADITLDAESAKQTGFRIQFPHVGYTHASEQIDLNVLASGLLLGTLPTIHTVTLAEVQVHHPAANVIGEGKLSLVPPFQFQASGAGDVILDDLLPKFFAHVPGVRDLQGHVAMTVMARGTPLQPTVRMGLDVQGLALNATHFGDISTDLVWVPKQLSIEALRITHPDAGIVTGSGHIDLVAPYTMSSALRLHGVSLPEVLHLTGVHDAWIRMLLNGDIRVHGQLAPFAIDGRIDTHIRDFASIGASYRNPAASTILSFPNATLAGPFHIDTHAATVTGLAISVPSSSRVHVDGRLSFDLQAGMALNVHGDTINLSDVGPIAGLAFKGTGPITATIAGPYNALVIGGTVEPNALSILGYTIGDTRAPLLFEHNKLSVVRGLVVRDGGEATIDGALDFAPTLPPHNTIHATASVTLENVGMAGLLRTFGVPPTLANRIDAPLSGHIALAGPIDKPVGSGSLHASHATIQGTPLGSLRLTGGSNQPGPNVEALWLRAQATTHRQRHSSNVSAQTTNAEPSPPDASPDDDAPSHIDIRIAFPHMNTLTGTLALDHIDLNHLSPFISGVPMAGTISAQGAFNGTFAALDGTISANIQHLELYGLHLGATALQGDAKNGSMQITGTTLDDHATLAMHLTLRDQIPYDGTAQVTDIDLGRLWPHLPEGLHATITGQLAAQGKLLQPNTTVAMLDLAAFDAAWNDFTFELTQAAQLGFRNRTLSISQIQLEGPQLQAQIQGTIPLQGNMNVRAKAQGDLSMLTKPLHGIEALRGPVELELHTTGSLTAPSVHGQLTAHDVHAHISAIEQSLEDGKADIVFAGHTIQVRTVEGRLGGGRAAVRGVIDIPPGQQPELQLDATLESVQARPQPDLNFTVSGELSLAGPMNRLQLTGNTQVDSLRYTHNVKLEDWLKNRNAAPLHVPAFDPSNNMKLGVRVRAKDNVLISNNVLEAELQLDLLVSGTAERPGVLGNITPLWARARYRDSVFVTKRATVDFVDEYGLTAQFDLQAATTACGMQINVVIRGDSDSYTVMPTGQDTNGVVAPQDVLSCLQFGLRLRDFAGPNAAGVSDALRGSLDALWTVSGLDERVRKLLPIRIDELRLTSRWSTLRKRTTPTVLVSKEVGNQFALKYSRSIDDISEQVLSIEYRVSPEATVQGSWLSATTTPTGDFGLDLRLHWELR